MGRHLSDRDIDRVVGLLDGWRNQLTWGALCNACEDVIGTTPVRQTLYRIERVRQAFLIAKERIRSRAEAITVPASLRVAAERIARLEAENLRLKKEQAMLREQFVVWQYNAHLRGLTSVDLNRSLPTIDRGQTEVD